MRSWRRRPPVAFLRDEKKKKKKQGRRGNKERKKGVWSVFFFPSKEMGMEGWMDGKHWIGLG
jgi:hypothetical protein